ncbi:MAG TPA: undecaprenyldiphospho-muramoylpentapeptide beta-N-acetylglucosaminyltransferase [Egibacteraceae bacterium]|nr:undecaprenyldiphospho-muramoylpentapeptide beta-N-acetylglucosaminyltransferase [Egibacteraceae bacterium]
MTNAGRILIAGGGTGGHVVPALATAAALAELYPQVEVEFVGTARGLESRLVPEAGWPLHLISAAPFQRRLSLSALRAPLALAFAARDALRLVKGPPRAAAAAVFGGYVSAPLAVAAGLARIPLVVHEQNAIPGLANRLAARWAQAIAVSFPDSAARLGHVDRVTVTGNPVRPGLAELDAGARRSEAMAAFDLDPGRRTLLVFGGSQGARRINSAAVGAAPLWSEPRGLQVLHATGRAEHAGAQAAWDAQLASGSPLIVRCEPYVERMDLAYAAADVAVCRSGASTTAELTMMGLPSVLVPYPHATADHQMANARALAESGAATVIPDADLDSAALVAAAERLLLDDSAHASAAAAARALARPHAAAALARLIADAAFAGSGRAPGRLGSRNRNRGGGASSGEAAGNQTEAQP